MRKFTQIILAVLSNLLIYSFSLGPSGAGVIAGKVIDDKGTPIPFANVSVEQGNSMVTGTTTDFDGVFRITGVQPGEYLVKVSSVGFQPVARSGVIVRVDEIVRVDFTLTAGVEIQEVLVKGYKIPLIKQDGGTSCTVYSSGRQYGATSHGASNYTRKSRPEFKALPSRGLAGAATMVGGVQEFSGGGIGSIRGGRDNGGTQFIYVDGVKVRGNSAITSANFEEVRVLTGGVPAKYSGDEKVVGAKSFAALPARGVSSVPNGRSRESRESKKKKRKEEKVESLAAGYDLYDQQKFKSVFSEPLSTFSIDVDAASYSQVRRSLNMGYLPPQEIVRIEEMVNYFSYDYAKPEADVPFSINTEVSDCPWNVSHRLVHIGLQGKEMELEKRPENNLVFLIDVSGSMSSTDKLPLLKRSLRLLVDQLESTDRISIVVYAGAAGLVLPSTKGDDRFEIQRAIDRLSSGGSTAGGAGIELAYSTAEKHFIKGGNNRVILCTDGDFNVGVSSEHDLEKLIEKKRETGVFLTVLGFGTGNFQDSKMETLADKGNGNFSYIDNLQEAQKVLVKEFWGTLFTIAKDVKIQIEFNPANVLAYRLIGYENRRLAAEDFNNDRKDAGELGAGHTVTALYEVIPAGGETMAVPNIDTLKYQVASPTVTAGLKDELLTVKLRYKKPDGEKSKLLLRTVSTAKIPLLESSDNLQFSAAVAQFGMTLLDKELHSGQREGQLRKVIELAKGSKGPDEDGRRAEFVRLAKLAIASE